MNNAVIPRPSFPTSWRGRTPGFSEFNILLNLLDDPALLIDQNRGIVLNANSHLLKLTAFTLAETLNTPIVDLLPDILHKELTPGDERETILSRRNREPLPVVARVVALDNNNQWFLLSLMPLTTFQQMQVSRQRQEQILNAIHLLASLSSQPDLESSLSLAMEIGRQLLESNILCVYQGDSEYPQLRRIAALDTEENGLLPDIIPYLNLARLSNPSLWLPGKRVTSDLHRIARINNLNYLASVPLGNEGAYIGLLVVGDTSAAPIEKIISLMEILGANITTALEHFLLANSLKYQINRQGTELTLHGVFSENAREGLIVLRPDLTILEMNPIAELMLGYANQEVLGKRVENILIGTETLASSLKSALQGIPTHNLGNINLHRRTGQVFLAHVQTIPVVTGEDLLGVVVIMSDVSENEQIRVRTQQLEQRALLGEVTAIFAHEVRNPINNISTGLQLLAIKLPSEDPNQELIGRLQHDCSRLTHLMESVLSFSRPMEYKLQPTDLGELLHRLLERWRPRMARVNVELYFQVVPDCPQVDGDPRALEQVFTNLISNAIHAMSETGGTLAIKLEPLQSKLDTKQIEVTVSDNGPGIPDEIRDHIFEPFVTTNPQGTGLGLAITKRIMTAHKGNIWVNSFPGGTVFHVCLPIIKGEVE